MTWFSPGRLSSLILQTNLELTVITTVAIRCGIAPWRTGLWPPISLKPFRSWQRYRNAL